MKYINKFSTNADYQAFTEGGGYVTPNICYVEETEGLVFKPEIIENNTLQFPVYLVEGDNGQLGIDLYNYLVGKYGMGYHDTIEESIFFTASNGLIYQILEVDVMFSIALFDDGGSPAAILRSNGSVE